MFIKFGPLSGKILLSLVFFFVSSMLLIIIMNPFSQNISYFATQFGFIISTMCMYFLFERKHRWSLGWQDLKRWNSLGLGVAIAVLIPTISTLLMVSMNMIDLGTKQFTTSMMVLNLLLFLTVAIGEEAFFRGYVFGLIKHSYNSKVAILTSSILFALIHLFNPNGMDRPIEHIVIEIINILLIGLLFGIAREITGSIWMPIALHFFINFMQSAVFGFVNGGKEVESFLHITYNTNSIWNGSGYGLESSLLLMPMLVISIIAVTKLKIVYINKG